MALKIDSSSKILVIAALPEDIAAACGGFISKYHSQIDLLCINAAKQLASQNIKTVQNFYEPCLAISKKAKVNKTFIEDSESFGLTNIKDIQNQNFNSEFNLKEYDIILIPHKDDKSPEHKYLCDTALKTILEIQENKDNLQILRYELWNPIKEANYYEDITQFVEKKKELILCYKADKFYADSILSNNKFRTFTSTLSGKAEFVEAFFEDDLNVYLEKPDIINEKTDENYTNPQIEKFLKESDTQTKINELSERYNGKSIAIFGAGEFTRSVFKNYNLSGLNIIAISDKRFEQTRQHEFYGLNCIKPDDLKNVEFDVLLISTEEFVKTYDTLTRIYLKDCNTEIAPLIKTDLSQYVNNSCGKICTRPFHTVSIVPTGECITCCPAYINNFELGNIYKEDFESIWKGKRAEYLRNALINDDYSICDLNTCIHMELKDKNELAEYFDKETSEIKMPDTIYMSWDYDCNVACITCRNQIIKNDAETLERFQVIEDRILSACKDAKYFYTSGNGDPFGSSYARGIIKKIVEINPNIKFLIHTNGTLCNKKMCDELKITDKIKTVTFSIHAATKEVYDKIVRYGNFDNVIKNLEWISSMKKEGKIEEILLVFVVEKLNYKDMPDFVRLAEKYDAIASFRYYRQWAHNTEYKYEDMAIFDEHHKEYQQFTDILQDKIFDSPHCHMDPSLRAIKLKK